MDRETVREVLEKIINDNNRTYMRLPTDSTLFALFETIRIAKELGFEVVELVNDTYEVR